MAHAPVQLADSKDFTIFHALKPPAITIHKYLQRIFQVRCRTLRRECYSLRPPAACETDQFTVGTQSVHWPSLPWRLRLLSDGLACSCAREWCEWRGACHMVSVPRGCRPKRLDASRALVMLSRSMQTALGRALSWL